MVPIGLPLVVSVTVPLPSSVQFYVITDMDKQEVNIEL